jgi:hypothetical protein
MEALRGDPSRESQRNAGRQRVVRPHATRPIYDRPLDLEEGHQREDAVSGRFIWARGEAMHVVPTMRQVSRTLVALFMLFHSFVVGCEGEGESETDDSGASPKRASARLTPRRDDCIKVNETAFVDLFAAVAWDEPYYECQPMCSSTCDEGNSYKQTLSTREEGTVEYRVLGVTCSGACTATERYGVIKVNAYAETTAVVEASVAINDPKAPPLETIVRATVTFRATCPNDPRVQDDPEADAGADAKADTHADASLDVSLADAGADGG